MKIVNIVKCPLEVLYNDTEILDDQNTLNKDELFFSFFAM